MGFQPIPKHPNFVGKLLSRSYPLHPKTPASPCSATVVRKSEKIEGCSLASTPLCLGFRERTKFNDLGLFRGYLKPKLAQPLIKLVTKPCCVDFTLETHNKIVSVPDNSALTATALLKYPRKPKVKAIMKIDVGENR
jgi:hypothetical protein